MKILYGILKKREALLSLIILVFFIAVGTQSPSFFTYENISNVLKACSVTGVFALGVLVVVISGGFDVSFTAIAQVSQYLTIWLALQLFPSGNLLITFIVAITIGLLLGLLNGYLIQHFKMPAIIITISTQNLLYGLMYVISEGKLIYEIPSKIWAISDTKLFLQMAENGSSYGISLVTVIWLVMALLMSYFLNFTVKGRSVYWIGGNQIAAERVGISTKNTTLFVYGFAGVIAAIGSILHVSIVQTVIPNSIVGTEMTVIAAVILGGASISGGKGSVLGTILGVILFAFISNSLTLLKISSYWYSVFTGIIIMLSIILNALQDMQHEKRKIRIKVDMGEK